MSAFYENILGLPRGKRPSFGMGGAWHYCGKQAVVHLVEAAKKFKTEEAQIEHFAFRSNGSIKSFQKKMREADTPYKVIAIELAPPSSDQSVMPGSDSALFLARFAGEIRLGDNAHDYH